MTISSIFTERLASLSPAAATCLILITVGAAVLLLNGSANPKHDKDGRLPPSLPYAIPLLGHLPEFLWDTQRLLARSTKHFSPTTPVRIQLLNRRISFLNGASSVVSLFRNSRFLSSERWLVQVLVSAFGVEAADAPFYLADDTGVGHQPDPSSTSQRPPEHRIFYLVYQSVHDGLSGSRLEEMQRQLVRNLSAQIMSADIGHDAWTEIPDLYAGFFRKMCFRASTTSLMGSRIWEVIPDLDADFWDFDGHLPSLFREMPAWLAPAAHKARNKMKDNIAKWQTYAHQHYDVNKEGLDDPREWEEYFGSHLMRTRHQFFQKMPLGKSTLAGDDLGLLWAATANAVPAISWMLLDILQRPELLAQVREEMAPYIAVNPAASATSNEPPIRVDIDDLCKQPLIQSIYAEVLRVHNGTVIARVPKVPTFKIDGWHFPKDQPIMVSTFDSARNPLIWNQGTSEDPHPVDEFWPERFLVDPKVPSSGPVLPSLSTSRKSQATQGRDESDDNEKRVASASSRGNFSLEGTEGSWVPYGGGSRMCPGRHFAKKELIVATAMFLAAFDIEVKMPDGGWVENDMSYFMFGVMHPKGPIPARIRRRAVV